MKKVFAGTMICLLLGTLAAPAAAESFKIVGSGGPMRLLRDAAAAFSKANPGISIEVPDSIGTGGGYKAAGEGEGGIVLGRVTRPPKGKELDYGLDYLLFAKCPVVFHSHPGIKIKGLSAAQAADLFTGKITNWKEVGGPDEKVRIVARQAGESNLLLIQQAVPAWKDLVITERSKITNTDQEMPAAVAENAGAIGFGFIHEGQLKKLNILELDGQAPTSATYPVKSDFALIYKKEKLTPGMKAFIDFLFSDAGEKVVRANAATPVPRK